MSSTPGKHWVSGRWISCCEEGEHDCPCTCHDEPPRTFDEGRPGGEQPA